MKVNSQKTELALKQASAEVNIFVIDVKSEVAKVVEKYAAIVPDATTKEGYQFCKDVRGIVLPIKTGIENARKELKAPITAAGKLVDESLKPLTLELEEVYKPFESAYRAVDNEKKIKEEARQERIQSAFNTMQQVILQAAGQSSSVIETMIEDLENLSFSVSTFQERTDEAVSTQAKIHANLTTMLNAQIAAEEQALIAVEMRVRMEAIEKKEAAIAENERKEKQRIADEKAAVELAENNEAIRVQARANAETKHKADMLEAEKNAKLREDAARVAESNRQEAIKKEEADQAAKREADKKHCAKIDNEILTKLMTVEGVTQKQGKAIITLVVNRLCGNMRINY